ncbi:MAG: hypothetical protein QNL68_11640 [Akkermansiaceae bacterium]
MELLEELLEGIFRVCPNWRLLGSFTPLVDISELTETPYFVAIEKNVSDRWTLCVAA